MSILELLLNEKTNKCEDGLYHYIQVSLTYNSNKIEGSPITEEETNEIYTKGIISVNNRTVLELDPIIETRNHFKAIDYILDIANETLSEEIIKELHRLLKTGTSDELVKGYAIGNYKERGNTIGGTTFTARPEEVPKKMKELIDKYLSKETVTTEDLAEFHVEFEKIHPFQDGNGRVGRLILFKECLKYDITPIIIEDKKKAFYYNGLQQWNAEKGFLVSTFQDAQESFKEKLDFFYPSKEKMQRISKPRRK